jgi:hypothetical protein
MNGTSLEQRSFSNYFLDTVMSLAGPFKNQYIYFSSIPYDDNGEGSEDRRAIGSASNRKAAYLPVRRKFVDIY